MRAISSSSSSKPNRSRFSRMRTGDWDFGRDRARRRTCQRSTICAAVRSCLAAIAAITGSLRTSPRLCKTSAPTAALVDKLSNGEIGYLHIRQMNEPSLASRARFLAWLARRSGRSSMSVSIRGGRFDQELLEILGQRQYQYTLHAIRLSCNGLWPASSARRWSWRTNASTSDAEVFPHPHAQARQSCWRDDDSGPSSARAPSTSSTIRTPGSGLWNVNGTNLENYGAPRTCTWTTLRVISTAKSRRPAPRKSGGSAQGGDAEDEERSVRPFVSPRRESSSG